MQNESIRENPHANDSTLDLAATAPPGGRPATASVEKRGFRKFRLLLEFVVRGTFPIDSAAKATPTASPEAPQSVPERPEERLRALWNVLERPRSS